MSDFTFTKEIFVHDFLNPPTRSFFTNWSLNLVKSNGDIGFADIQMGGVEAKHVYLLKLKGHRTLGLLEANRA
jgi:hypothetical protein